MRRLRRNRPAPAPPVAAPEPPGFLAQVQDKAAGAGTAVASGLRSMMPQPPMPQQLEQARKAQVARNDQVRQYKRESVRERNQRVFQQIDRMYYGTGAALAEQSAMQYQQQVNAGLGWQQQQANQVNEMLRRRANGGY